VVKAGLMARTEMRSHHGDQSHHDKMDDLVQCGELPDAPNKEHLN